MSCTHPPHLVCFCCEHTRVAKSPPPRTPAYYIGEGMHASDVIDAFGLNSDWRLASAVSYALRCGRKGGNDDAIRDLEKAIHFLQSALAFRQGKRGKETMEIGK